jgi:transcriptional regulator with XRE-family HTH domain
VKEKEEERSYLTQAEVASRFRVSQSTVINWRKKRLLDYFQAPGSTKVLYPAVALNDFENRSIHKVEGVVRQKKIAKKSPEISTITTREWRI